MADFDNASKDRIDVKIINSNDPSGIPEAFSQELVEPPRNDAEAPKSPHRRHRDRTPTGEHRRRTPNRSSAGSLRSIETSPRRSRQLGESAKHRSPAQSPTGRSRMSPHNEPVEKPLAVPKFGDWDEADPSSAEAFSDIFKNARKGKHTRSPTHPGIKNGTSKYRGRKRAQPFCCSWFSFWK